MIIRSDGSNYFTFRGNASSGSGCASVDPSACILKGSAANSGLNNDAADIAIGLLSAHNVILATNSLQRAQITSAGLFIVGASTSCPGGSLLCVFSAASSNTAQFDSTSGTTQVLLTNSGIAAASLTATSPAVTLNANNGSGTLALQTNSTDALKVDASQRILVGTTTASARASIKSSAGQDTLFLDAAAGANSASILFANGGTAKANLYFNSTDLIMSGNSNGTTQLIFQTGASNTEAFRVNASQQVLVGASSASASTNRQEIHYNGSANAGLFINSTTDTCTGGSHDTCDQILFGTAGTAYGILEASSRLMILNHGTRSFLGGGGQSIDLGSSGVTITSGSSATIFSPNNGVVFPTCSFGSFPTGAIGVCTCTNCKNSSQDGTTSGSTCQAGAHNALAFYNGNSTVCN